MRSGLSIGWLLALATLGCGSPSVGTDAGSSTDAFASADSPVGRWAGRTSVTDFTFASGRPVSLDELFEFDADGQMRGDFSGIDDTSGCVVFYQLAGTWALSDSAIDVSWSSIRSSFSGCLNASDDQPETDVTADEGDIWDNELDGLWVISPTSLAITTGEGVLSYARVTSPLVARWEGMSSVTDFVFAEGREVPLTEDFWINQDGSIVGYFTAEDAVSGCAVDYRLSGTWSVMGASLDATWTRITNATGGCTDASLNNEREDVTSDEGAMWNAELDGTWVVSDAVLTLQTADGTLVYRRPS